MSKAATKSRKKRPNCKLAKGTQSDIFEQQQQIKTPQMRLFEANRILCGQLLPSKFKFRQKQVSQIEDTIKNLVKNKKNQSKMIMITGSPGAGKTMSTNYVLQKLSKQDFKIISLNSNMLKNKKDVQTIIAQNLLSQKQKQKYKLQQNEKTLTTFKLIDALQKQKQKPQKCIIYIEQVQLFFNSNKQVLSQDFFDIFSNKNLKIILLGISNTIDTIQKYSKKINIKINQITNIVFNPYTIDQLKQIIIDKFQQVYKISGFLIKYQDRMIKFIANKISQNKKGDMRSVFQFLKNLSHELFTQQQQIKQSQQNNKQIIKQLPKQYQLTYDIISRCLSPNSLKIHIIKTLPLHCQIVLIAIQQFLIQYQQISITQQQLIKKMNIIYQTIGLQNKKDITKQIQYLQTYGMISKKQTKGKCKYLLNISTNDIKNIFQQHPVLGKFV